MKKVLFIVLSLLLFSCATTKGSSCGSNEKCSEQKECCSKPDGKK